MKLIYLPLERYQERYTEWLSGEDGAIESDLKALNIPYVAVRPNNDLHQISSGRVIDIEKRMEWAFDQTKRLATLVLNDKVSSDDVIFMEDFWHPGMEMIPYVFSSKFGADSSKWPKVYAFCCAQSCDPHDFTAPWKGWINSFENAWSNVLTGVFVSCPEHKALANEIAPDEKIYVTGLMFNSKVVRALACSYDRSVRLSQVVWSSRWDSEKRPELFCKLVEQVLLERNDIDFVVCSGFKTLVSNDSKLLSMAHNLERKFNNFAIKTNLSKAEYYNILMESKVQFNCASQDWVSNTLLEAATFGCLPLYPDYLSFPAAVNYEKTFLYKDMRDAKRKLYALIDGTVTTPPLSRIYDKYDHTFRRMLKVMGFDTPPAIQLKFE